MFWQFPSRIRPWVRCISNAILMALATTASQAPGGRILNETLITEEGTAFYSLYIPDGFSGDDPWPLVVNMHGFGDTRQGQMNYSRMNTVADNGNFLLVYPEAIGRDWNERQLPGEWDSVSFIDRVLNEISSDFAVDPSRVYATGMSQGGAMSYVLGIKLPDRFAAIASVSGVIPEGAAVFGRTPNRPIPILHIHGTGDEIVPFGGGFSPNIGLTFPSVTDALGSWIQNNGCEEEATTSELTDTNINDSSTVLQHHYSNCDAYPRADGSDQSPDSVLYEVVNGGHSWPGADFNPSLGVVNGDIDASQEIWDFFSAHTLVVPGDINLDGIVDEKDFAVWDAHKFTESDSWTSGDLNRDGFIDVSDFNIWNVKRSETANAVNAIPEPATRLMVFVSLVSVLCVCRGLALRSVAS